MNISELALLGILFTSTLVLYIIMKHYLYQQYIITTIPSVLM